MVNGRLLAGALLALALATAQADSGPLPSVGGPLDPALLDQVKALGQAAKAARETAAAGADAQWVADMAARALAQGAAGDDADSGQPTAEKRAHPLGEGERVLIFVSWSMGAHALKDILGAFDGLPGVGIVFRGIPEGMTMAAAVSKMHQLTQETQSSVSVLLDPLAFRRHGVTLVPTVALEAADDRLIVKATGSSSVAYIREAAAQGRRGDLGSLGETADIIEPDLMEVAQQRIAELDTEAMKRRAVARFWDNHRGTPLPPVTEATTRRVDASVIIPDDILDAQGRVVQKAGRLNPLDLMPFDQKLVVIDPTQDWQVELARREYAGHGAGLTVTVLATQIPVASGWDLFNSVQDHLEAPLYLLPPDMAERFQILRVPSVVTADARDFIVREIAPAASGEVVGEH